MGDGLQEAHPCTCRLAHSVGKAVLLSNWGALWHPHELGSSPEGGASKTGKLGLQEAEGQAPLTSNQRIQMDNPPDG